MSETDATRSPSPLIGGEGPAESIPAVADVRRTLVSIFATPISNTRIERAEALNAALRELILHEERHSPGLARSNVGGWHSAIDFLDRDVEAVRQLRRHVHAHLIELCRAVARDPQAPAVLAFELEGWANVLRYGQYNSLHCHPNAFWSGVYFVTGNPEPAEPHPFSGKLELIDPRPGASLSYSDHTNLYGRFLVNPVAGQIVVFPGWLQHQVHPFFGPGERISIAFNAAYR